MLAAAPRLGETADDGILPPVRLDLEPIVSSRAFTVRAFSVLGEDAFEIKLSSGLIERDTGLLDVLTEPDIGCGAHDPLQDFFTPCESQGAQVVTIQVQKIKHIIDQRSLACPQVALQELEVRLSVLIEHDHLAIENRVVPELLERAAQWGELSFKRDLVTRIQVHTLGIDFRGGSIAVPFWLEDPASAVERPSHQGGQHRLDLAGHFRPRSTL